MTVPMIPPTPEQVYDALPYHYPKADEPQTVIRIPIAGPSPFNTLVHFRWRCGLGNYDWASGHTHHASQAYATQLVLKSYDANDPRQQTIEHSSTAVIMMNQIDVEADFFTDDGNTDWTVAVEAIPGDAHIDESGRVSITIDTSWRYFQVDAAAAANITTWALIYEPRTQTLDHLGHSDLQHQLHQLHQLGQRAESGRAVPTTRSSTRCNWMTYGPF